MSIEADSLGIMIYPIMPDTSNRILSFYKIDVKDITLDMLNYDLSGTKMNKVKPLFPRVE